jgi:hypothetical protein
MLYSHSLGFLQDKDLKAYVEEAKTRGLSVAVVHNWRVNPYFKAAATCSIEWEAFLARFVPFFMPEGAGTAAPGSCAAPAELQLDVDTTVMLEDLVEDPPIRVAAAAAAAAPGPLGPAASAEHQVGGVRHTHVHPKQGRSVMISNPHVLMMMSALHLSKHTQRTACMRRCQMQHNCTVYSHCRSWLYHDHITL